MIDAYGGQVHTAKPGKGLSQDVNNRIDALRQRLTQVKAQGGEGDLAATVHAMSEQEAVDTAAEIVSLAWAIERELP